MTIGLVPVLIESQLTRTKRTIFLLIVRAIKTTLETIEEESKIKT